VRRAAAGPVEAQAAAVVGSTGVVTGSTFAVGAGCGDVVDVVAVLRLELVDQSLGQRHL
jgi:hypothetical protein